MLVYTNYLDFLLFDHIQDELMPLLLVKEASSKNDFRS